MAINPNAVMFIKSTMLVGYTDKTKEAFGTQNLIFSLNFYPKANPSAITCTVAASSLGKVRAVEMFAKLLKQGAIKPDAHSGHRQHRGRGHQAIRQHLPRHEGAYLTSRTPALSHTVWTPAR
jgi:hypothetical protein